MLAYVTLTLLVASFVGAGSLYLVLRRRVLRGIRTPRSPLDDENYLLIKTRRASLDAKVFTIALMVVILGCALVVYLGVYDLFRSWQHHGHLTPPDAPQAVTVFLAILAGVTAAIAALAGAWEKIIRARGEVQAQLRLAENDNIRALAERERAHQGIPIAPTGSDQQ
ncbi:hypothetical protein K4B79_03550 [Streptomyces lincolnensis]|uniref:hypothetical protein n=1 Tax=Streptomyces lincolnensis TaxID=1915 RepID=UPI001E607BF6|nr:hypothetical protein [Streptomyces lincolnensis]MCD7437294.1 hypothetical protein [Streptomyces lincolnensis]